MLSISIHKKRMYLSIYLGLGFLLAALYNFQYSQPMCLMNLYLSISFGGGGWQDTVNGSVFHICYQLFIAYIKEYDRFLCVDLIFCDLHKLNDTMKILKPIQFAMASQKS